jgi:hypothetical protein
MRDGGAFYVRSALTRLQRGAYLGEDALNPRGAARTHRFAVRTSEIHQTRNEPAPREFTQTVLAPDLERQGANLVV